MKKALFVRKAANLEDLKAGIGGGQYETEFVVGKIIKLTPEQYKEFSENLLDDYSFIAENIALMYVGINHDWHCILVKEQGSSTGILVESEGYAYARYAAYYGCSGARPSSGRPSPRGRTQCHQFNIPINCHISIKEKQNIIVK